MNDDELKNIVIRNADQIAQIRSQLTQSGSRERRAVEALDRLRHRVQDALGGFDRDGYKATDQRLLVYALAAEILIFDKLGYDIGEIGCEFLLGVYALLQGRNSAALEHLGAFIASAEQSDRNLGNAHYLSGMISYNRRDFAKAAESFRTAFRLSPEKDQDWQSFIYVGELSYFMRKPRDVIERAFLDIENLLKSNPELPERHFLWATLYLKLGNCYVGTFLSQKGENPMTNDQIAIAHFKEARRRCPRLMSPNSLLPVVIDYSLAQALLLSGSVDMDLPETSQELLDSVFHRLRRIVLTKREETILAQSYFMLGTCPCFSANIPNDMGEIYMEYARHQTLSVPSDVCFYSCVTKELLSRDDFVGQIDFYTTQLLTDRGR